MEGVSGVCEEDEVGSGLTSQHFAWSDPTGAVPDVQNAAMQDLTPKGGQASFVPHCEQKGAVAATCVPHCGQNLPAGAAAGAAGSAAGASAAGVG